MEVQSFAIGASKLVGTAWRLFPWEGLRALGNVLLEGVSVYKEKAANGKNVEPFRDSEWVEERTEHAFDHFVKYLRGDKTEDHLTKIAWFCLMMKEAEARGVLTQPLPSSGILAGTTNAVNITSGTTRDLSFAAVYCNCTDCFHPIGAHNYNVAAQVLGECSIFGCTCKRPAFPK
jgi:hypothetical protein